MGLRRGFTLIELLVVMAVIAILAGLLFPAFAQVREDGWKTTCLSNCQQVANAVMMYAQDYDESILPWLVVPFGRSPHPEETGWTYLIQPYLKSGGPQAVGGRFQANGVLMCPSFSLERLKKALDA